jgi:hypothetical protein
VRVVCVNERSRSGSGAGSTGTGSESGRDDARPPKLLDQVRAAVRVRNWSPRTEDAYVHWIRRFILFHEKRHPAALGGRQVAPLRALVPLSGAVPLGRLT